jgi:assimilatory nitrate reductase catalytic subunit
MSETVRTTCPYCGVGCGLTVSPTGRIEGDRDHPANFGRLCSKGAALAETLGEEERLLHPMIHGERADWADAIDLIADRFAQTIKLHGPDSVAFYVSGQFLTEDYYVANKLMKGFIGSGNIDTNSRLCMASSVAGHVRAFGGDVVPGNFEDFEQADLVVLVGSNIAWCHPVLYQRLMAARADRGTKIVVIDPRRTATAEQADVHLALRPGSDVALFAGLLAHLVDNDAIDHNWIDQHTSGFEPTLAAARAASHDLVAKTDLKDADIAGFFALFQQTDRVVTAYSQGVNQSSCGTDKVNAIVNCHLTTGRIGRPGCGPFSLTGQPNAMGGREVGGLANQLAAHMGFSDPDHHALVSRFWGSTNTATQPGLKAVDMFEAIADGRIRAVWIAATNPADSLPRSDLVREALKSCPFVVVADCWSTDTTALAHVVLPAAAWGEKDGTVTNSERRISRQRAFRTAPGEAKSDWWMLAELGKKLGWVDQFAWANAAAVFREHAALSGFENRGEREFNISGLADIDDQAYDDLAPIQWPVIAKEPPSQRLYSKGGFPTADGRARLIPTAHRPPVAQTTEGFPFLLNTGRLRDQWHTMTRTGRVPRLGEHAAEPWLQVSAYDAAVKNLNDGDLVKISSADGTSITRVAVTNSLRAGDVFLPMHWTDQFSSAGPIGRLVGAACDPISGQPELKATSVNIQKLEAAWTGIMLHRHAVLPQGIDYWARVRLNRGHGFELSGLEALQDHQAVINFADKLMTPKQGSERLEFVDQVKGIWRFAYIAKGRLESCLFLSAGRPTALPARRELAALLGAELDPVARLSLLAGATNAGGAPKGRTICACFSVGLNTLLQTISTDQLMTVDDIGLALNAGTNCGSCIPELKEILRDARRTAA